MNLAKLSKINELVALNTLRKPKIVINPKANYSLSFSENNSENEFSADIIIDSVQWKIPQEQQEFVNELAKDSTIDNETKIILLFEELAKKYTYDDNVLTYIRKIDDDEYELPDWYGRNPDTDWKKNREQHNKKVCYEVSRILAKSSSEIFKNDKSYNTCVLWDQARTHYFGALTTDDYTITLDLDDFDNIKDLTRVKTNLTIEGIKILEDPKNVFTNALNSYNKTKQKHAIKSVNNEIHKTEFPNEDTNQEINEDVTYLTHVLDVLKEKYNLDSQGIFEYMKEIIDITIGTKKREKIWKKISDKIYTRCIILDLDDNKYIIDVDKKIIRPFHEKEFESENPEFIPFKDIKRDWNDCYDGRI